MNSPAATAPLTPAPGPTLFGQPRGLATLFLTEMWERFTYYGMRAGLILFMVAATAKGGLGFSDKTASAIYGLYVGGTYLCGLFGGWVADRLLGAQRAVIAGALFIICGNAMLALGDVRVFLLGLLIIAIGIGFLKPNASAMVSSLYPEGGSRRDAGFSIFYMGINLGGLLGPLLVPLVADRFGSRWGFALPALGMVLGLVQFTRTRRYLGTAGAAPSARGSWTPVFAIGAAAALIAALAMTGAIHLDAVALAEVASWAYAVLAVGYFAFLLFFAGLTPTERKRAIVMAVLFAASVTFWTGYEQQGSSFNLFAERYTDRHIFGWNMPAGMLQGVSPASVILLAPVFAALWLALGRRGRDLSAPAKLGCGLLFLGLGFLVMYFAAGHVLAGHLVAPTWLVCTFVLHTCGEVCLYPVGMSYMSKLSPPRFAGQVMGLWFVSLALGGNLAGQLAGQYDASHLESLPGMFLRVCLYGIVGGALMLLFTPAVKKLMAGVH